MRDDLDELFQKLVLLHYNKKSCLEQFSSNEIQLRHLLQTGNSTEIYDLIKVDNDIIVKLDSIEFDIHALIDEICRIAGIEKENFNRYLMDRNVKPMTELKQMQDDINKYLSGLVTERNEFINAMDNKLDEIKKDIKELNDIQRLKD